VPPGLLIEGKAARSIYLGVIILVAAAAIMFALQNLEIVTMPYLRLTPI
jgi:hypothetical protein